MKKQLAMAIASLVLIIGVSFSWGTSLFRVIVPTENQLLNFSKNEGELAFQSSTRNLLIFREGSFKNVDEIRIESIPVVKKITADSIEIGPGKVLIDGGFYVSDTSISCSYLSQGIGGYDVNSPSIPQVAYLFLIQDPNDILKFSCIITDNASGPVSINAPARRIVSFWSGSNFSSHKGVTYYQQSSYPTHTVPAGTYSNCQEISLSVLAPTIDEYELNHTCDSTNSVAGELFNDSTCSEYRISGCYGPGPFTSMTSAIQSDEFKLFANGSFSLGQKISIVRTIEDITGD